MTAGRRAALLAVITVVCAALVLAASLWPVVGPLTQRTPLPSAGRSVHGVPVPESARPCAAQDPEEPAQVRWCLPDGVSAATVERWYHARLPPRRNLGELRWCVEQHGDDGSRTALWSTRRGLVGYVLPPEQQRPGIESHDDRVAVAVVRMDGRPCHPAARASRERA